MAIKKIRAASQLAAATLNYLSKILKPGITSNEINHLCHQFIIKNQGHPGALNYKGFPKSLCVSINNEVCHGIPKNQIIKEGDLVKLDVVVKKDGYFGDTCRCFVVGKGSPLAHQLKQVTYDAMWIAIKMVKPGVYINEIGTAIENHAKSFGFSCVRDFCGHGIGEKMHMDPYVPHFDTGEKGSQLKSGMTFTIEPMINQGDYKIKILADKWTAVTADNGLSAQWEHTILVTETGYEVLTLSEEEKATME
jgi:methionyl aminopeptidase